MPLQAELIAEANARDLDALDEDYAALGRKLERSGIAIDAIKDRVAGFSVAVPSWGAGRGGTRFAKFPIPGEPTDIHEKLEDCAVINQLCRVTPRVSPHFPWDKVDDYAGLREEAASLGLGFDAVNSNTFQDQPGQAQTYATGSLSSTVEATRRQAVEHNIECIEIGRQLGSTDLTVWVGDGTNFPGQQDFARSLDRYLEAAAEVYAALPENWRMLLEHKMFEPAFYSTVVQDWGTNYLIAQELGPKAYCLVDLGHHAPNVNIEMIVARLIQFKKLGGFHFNDSKYGDDDLDTGSIDPYRLFLVFNELVDAETRIAEGFSPAHMLDQSHNVTDPIESLMNSAMEVSRAYAQALLVDRKALEGYQDSNDALMATETLKSAFRTHVEPILAMARFEAGGAIAPVAAYRASGYRAKVSSERPASKSGGGGIV